VLTAQKTFRVWHQSKHPTALVLQTGNGQCAAVHVVRVGERHQSFVEVALRDGGIDDEPSLGVRDGQFEGLGEQREKGVVGTVVVEPNPAALKTAAGVVDEATIRQQPDFGENLEPVANAMNWWRRSPIFSSMRSWARRPAMT